MHTRNHRGGAFHSIRRLRRRPAAGDAGADSRRSDRRTNRRARYNADCRTNRRARYNADQRPGQRARDNADRRTNVRILHGDRAVRIDRKLERGIRPSHLANTLLKNQRKRSGFSPARFLESLHAAA